MPKKLDKLCMNIKYVSFTLFVGFDLLLNEESVSCQLDSHHIGNVLFFVMVVLASVMMIIVDHLGFGVVGVAVVRTGIDSQGVFGGSRLGLPGLQCTITHPPPPPPIPLHFHNHQCSITQAPPPPRSLHRHCHQTTSIDATILSPT